MAKTQRSSPQQLQLRVFADVNGGSSRPCDPQAASHERSAGAARACYDEATPEDRAIYQAIADRYFKSEA